MKTIDKESDVPSSQSSLEHLALVDQYLIACKKEDKRHVYISSTWMAQLTDKRSSDNDGKYEQEMNKFDEYKASVSLEGYFWVFGAYKLDEEAHYYILQRDFDDDQDTVFRCYGSSKQAQRISKSLKDALMGEDDSSPIAYHHVELDWGTFVFHALFRALGDATALCDSGAITEIQSSDECYKPEVQILIMKDLDLFKQNLTYLSATITAKAEKAVWLTCPLCGKWNIHSSLWPDNKDLMTCLQAGQRCTQIHERAKRNQLEASLGTERAKRIQLEASLKIEQAKSIKLEAWLEAARAQVKSDLEQVLKAHANQIERTQQKYTDAVLKDRERLLTAVKEVRCEGEKQQEATTKLTSSINVSSATQGNLEETATKLETVIHTSATLLAELKEKTDALDGQLEEQKDVSERLLNAVKEVRCEGEKQQEATTKLTSFINVSLATQGNLEETATKLERAIDNSATLLVELEEKADAAALLYQSTVEARELDDPEGTNSTANHSSPAGGLGVNQESSQNDQELQEDYGYGNNLNSSHDDEEDSPLAPDPVVTDPKKDDSGSGSSSDSSTSSNVSNYESKYKRWLLTQLNGK